MSLYFFSISCDVFGFVCSSIKKRGTVLWLLDQAAREGFCQQIQGLSGISGETSIVVRIGADLAKAALQIAAEDDSLISHSSVPLPVDAFVERLDDLSMGFCSLYMPPLNSPPEVFLGNLERYFYVHKVVTYGLRCQ